MKIQCFYDLRRIALSAAFVAPEAAKLTPQAAKLTLKTANLAPKMANLAHFWHPLDDFFGILGVILSKIAKIKKTTTVHHF